MNRTVLGAFAMLLLIMAGLFWWQGRAAIDPGKLPSLPKSAPQGGVALPMADGKGLKGAALPEATEATKEQRRFDRLDRNHDSRIARVEMLAPRVAAFRKLDTDGNNLLSFEEWSVRTSNKFKGADRNGDGILDRDEFATTKAKPKPKAPTCKCGAKAPPAPPTDSDDD
jgi:hypothetical protein